MIEAAQLTKALLEELGFVTFLKTTGGKGLHIVTPIQRTVDWEEAKGFAKMVADHSKANEELKAIADARNVKLPTVVEGQHREHINDLGKKNRRRVRQSLHEHDGERS